MSKYFVVGAKRNFLTCFPLRSFVSLDRLDSSTGLVSAEHRFAFVAMMVNVKASRRRPLLQAFW